MDNLVGIYVRINKEVYGDVKKYCNKYGFKVKAFIESAMINELDKRGHYGSKTKRKFS